MEEKFTFFYKSKLSQWHMVRFEVDGVFYNCAEQYMMSQKALLFKDSIMYDKIMKTNDPYEQQGYGRMVSNYDQVIWDANKYNIVYKGNYERFKQNDDQWDLLNNTGNTTLVEASPFDLVYGIGLSITNPDRFDKSKWRGKNLLGIILTDVRNNLRVEKFK